MNEKTVLLLRERLVSITPYLINELDKPAILICPGGGYSTCEPAEGEPVAREYNLLGYNAFVLTYTVGANCRWPMPLEDFELAMEHLEENAHKYHIDARHIVAVGLSAGGHLVAMASSVAKRKPFASILCYAPTTKETIDYVGIGAPDAAQAVNSRTCPCFLVSSRNDWIVPISSMMEYIAQLNRNFIDYESHIYGYAMHGFSIGEKVGAVGEQFCSRVGDWVAESASWINELVSGAYVSIRECAEYSDRFLKQFSVTNSCQLIFGTNETLEALKLHCPTVVELYYQALQTIGVFIQKTTLKNVIEFFHLPKDTIAQCDVILKQFKRNG